MIFYSAKSMSNNEDFELPNPVADAIANLSKTIEMICNVRTKRGALLDNASVNIG